MAVRAWYQEMKKIKVYFSTDKLTRQRFQVRLAGDGVNQSDFLNACVLAYLENDVYEISKDNGERDLSVTVRRRKRRRR